VPIAKYFVVVGGALAVLLLIAGWSLPVPPASFPDQSEIIERAAIRIRSERKWPEKVVLDTSKPTMRLPLSWTLRRRSCRSRYRLTKRQANRILRL
jgi:hypothetical protein